MPAKSKEQQTAMRMALAARRGDIEVSKLKGAALEIYKSDMTNKEIEDFTVLEQNKQNKLNKNMKNLVEFLNESIENIYEDAYKSNIVNKNMKIFFTDVSWEGKEYDFNFLNKNARSFNSRFNKYLDSGTLNIQGILRDKKLGDCDFRVVIFLNDANQEKYPNGPGKVCWICNASELKKYINDILDTIANCIEDDLDAKRVADVFSEYKDEIYNKWYK